MDDYSFYGKYRWTSQYRELLDRDWRDPVEIKEEHFDKAEKHFIARLKKLLVDRNVLKQDLAEAIGVSPSAISGYLVGKHNPDIATLLAISNYFDVSLDYLLGKTEYTHINDGNLPPLENEMLGYYRKLDDFRQRELLGEARYMYKSDKKSYS